MVLVLFILFFASAASYKPAPRIKCVTNELYMPCKTICPPQTCDMIYKDFLCNPKPKCVPGCDCVDGYLRNEEKICIFNETCPGMTEETTHAPPEPPESPPECDSSPTANATDVQYNSNTSTSTFDSSSSCSSSSQSSFSSSSSSRSSFSSLSSSSSSSQSSSTQYSSSRSVFNKANAGLKRDCTYNSCTPTCSIPFTQNCPEDSNPCNCSPGTIVSQEGGKCVPKEECPKYANCKGDYNASYTDCPSACPSTCAKPDVEYCNNTCGYLGCACKSGYLLNEVIEKCIKPEDCPGGIVCGQNETLVDCLIKSPDILCPANDNRSIDASESVPPCSSGCGCQENYRRKSVDEYICILASDCPPVNCTRPNEQWSSCPEPCFSDQCSERNKIIKPKDCPYSDLDCRPQCICEEGFYRNETDFCVTAEECPPENTTNVPPDLPESPPGYNSSVTTNTQMSGGQPGLNIGISSLNSSPSTSSAKESLGHVCTYNSCTPTCSIPYTQNCPVDSNPCNCPPGSIVSEEGGKCVPKDECPKYANCKGDYNASYTDCPSTCPSTCIKPDADYCNSTCGFLGCACNSGYLLSDVNGTCIKPEDCPGGNACGQNETFVDCLPKSPSIYCPVNDNRHIDVCESDLPCPSGCRCQKYYKRKSVDDYTCILASDCPPVNCTRPNEQWNSCPEPCVSDYCSERTKVTKPGDCPYSDLDCRPQCICKQGFYRNGTDICVTADECPPANVTATYKD